MKEWHLWLILVVVAVILVLLCMSSGEISFEGIFGGPECANGCGNSADPECMAEMCDNCCDYWMGLNGCYAKHYDSKWD